MTLLYNASPGEDGTSGMFCISWAVQRRSLVRASPDVIGAAARELTNLFHRLRSRSTSGYGDVPISGILDSVVQIDALQSRALVLLSSADPMPVVGLDADAAEKLAAQLLDAAKTLRASPAGKSQ
jgi:hypothetical protein